MTARIDPEVLRFKSACDYVADRMLRFATTQIGHRLSGDVARWFADDKEHRGEAVDPEASAPIRHTVAGIWCVTIPADDYDALRARVATLQEEAGVRDFDAEHAHERALAFIRSIRERGFTLDDVKGIAYHLARLLQGETYEPSDREIPRRESWTTGAKAARKRCFGCLHFDNELTFGDGCQFYSDGHCLRDVDARGQFIPSVFHSSPPHPTCPAGSVSLGTSVCGRPVGHDGACKGAAPRTSEGEEESKR